ncbi:MAG: archaetidylserine decarboxylase [Gammaproteobacteria bacterium]
MLASLLDHAFVLFQRLLPEQLLGRWVRALTRARTPWLRTFLIRAFIKTYPVNLSEVENPEPEAWENVNAFFTRPLRPGVRPVAPGNTTVVCPCDGMLEDLGYASGQMLLQAKRFRYRLADLLAMDETEALPFHGGGTATIYLAPQDYHRVHMPLSARVTDTVYVPGRRWAVNRRTVRAVNGLFAANERVIVWCESDSGRFAVVLVGALNVASISLAWCGEIPSGKQVVRTHYPVDDPALRIPAGGLLGQFNLGSTVIIVAEHGLMHWDTNRSADGGQLPAPVRMGTRIGTAPAPDAAS